MKNKSKTLKISVKELKALSDKIGSVVAIVYNNQQEIAKLKVKIEVLEKRIQDLTVQDMQLLNQIEGFKEVLKNQETNIKALTDIFKLIKKELKNIEDWASKRIIELENNIKHLEVILNTKIQVIENLRKKVFAKLGAGGENE